MPQPGEAVRWGMADRDGQHGMQMDGEFEATSRLDAELDYSVLNPRALGVMRRYAGRGLRG